jgi:hypothetical protein
MISRFVMPALAFHPTHNETNNCELAMQYDLPLKPGVIWDSHTNSFPYGPGFKSRWTPPKVPYRGVAPMYAKFPTAAEPLQVAPPNLEVPVILTNAGHAE